MIMRINMKNFYKISFHFLVKAVDIFLNIKSHWLQNTVEYYQSV